ncbi:hypothetical protein D1872_304160 [compost metagenome]
MTGIQLPAAPSCNDHRIRRIGVNITFAVLRKNTLAVACLIEQQLQCRGVLKQLNLPPQTKLQILHETTPGSISSGMEDPMCRMRSFPP